MTGVRSRVGAYTLACLAALSFATVTKVSAQQRSAGAHQHGASTLTVAQSGTRIDIRLVSPGSDIVGFEHSPGNDEERARLSQAIAQLEAPFELFTFNPDMDCKADEAKVSFGDDEDDDGDDHTDHAEFVADYRFECSASTTVAGIDLPLLAKFPAMETITLQYILNGKVGRLDIHRDAPRQLF